MQQQQDWRTKFSQISFWYCCHMNIPSLSLFRWLEKKIDHDRKSKAYSAKLTICSINITFCSIDILWSQPCGSSLERGSFLLRQENCRQRVVHADQNFLKNFDYSTQSPDVELTEHLWDELERRLWAKAHHPTSVPDFTDALVSDWEKIPAVLIQHCGKPSQKSGSFHRKRKNFSINASGLKTKCQTHGRSFWMSMCF